MKLKIIILLALSVAFFNCSDDEGSGSTPATPTPPVTLVQASFEWSVSPTDPNVVLLDNTTTGTSAFTSEWDFGLGGAFVVDAAGLEEVTFSEPGQYTVSLLVSNSAGTTTATKTIKVDENGVCATGFCGNGGATGGSGLKGAAQGFNVGMIARSGRLSGNQSDAFKEDFNQLTSEYQMKMNIMYPSQDNYDFSAGDAIVNYAVANGMDVHGHALIWHNATPDWVRDFSGTDSQFEDMVEDYITTTVQRYSGKVKSWDVVNEAIDDGSGNPLRESVFKDRMGNDYIRKCFQYARNADPTVLLFYNDYNMASSDGKRAAMFDIVDDLGDLVDGVGAQLHISYNGPSAAKIRAVSDGGVSRGKLVHFSELDIRANPSNDLSSLNNSRELQQAEKFKEVVEIYNEIPNGNKFALTVWGLRDNESWLLDFWGHVDWPLMYNEDYSKKQAYNGFMEGLQ